MGQYRLRELGGRQPDCIAVDQLVARDMQSQDAGQHVVEAIGRIVDDQLEQQQ
jgi:hypothetical protein